MASNAIKEYALTNARGRLMVDGSFSTSGTGTVTLINGRGFSVTRTSAGVFTVSLSSAYPSLVTVQANAVSTTALNTAELQCSPVVTTTTPNTFTITNYSVTSTGSTPVANDFTSYGAIVCFRAVFMNSSSSK